MTHLTVCKVTSDKLNANFMLHGPSLLLITNDTSANVGTFDPRHVDLYIKDLSSQIV